MKTNAITDWPEVQIQRFNSRIWFARIVFRFLILYLIFGAVIETRSAYLYWGNLDGGDIRRANLDGTGQKILVTGITVTLGPTLDVARGHMYWGDPASGAIRRANLDGTGQKTLISGLPAPG